jgi:hypothetical protein
MLPMLFAPVAFHICPVHPPDSDAKSHEHG